MEEYFVIKIFDRDEIHYIFICENIVNENPTWLENTPYTATKFKTYEEAKQQLKNCRDKHHLGGIYQIEKIYILR